MGGQNFMYDNMQLAELRKVAKEMGLKNITKLKKSELIEVLKKESLEKGQEEKKKELDKKETNEPEKKIIKTVKKIHVDEQKEEEPPKEKFVGGNRSI